MYSRFRATLDKQNSNTQNMDKREAVEIAEKYVQAINGRFNLEKVFLFGSAVKGNFNSGSDIDIALVIPDEEDRLNAQIELMKLRRSVDVRIEPLPFRHSEFNSADPMVEEIVKHGIKIN